MTPLDIDRIRQVGDFESLILFLRDELEWPLEAEDIEELSFDYEPEELGLSNEVAVKVNYIKQLRPLAENQPWGIFYIDFEPKTLPVVVLRKVLQNLVIKKRPGSQNSKLPGWNSHDLLFINSFGTQEERKITFAHFKPEKENNLLTLKVIGWDGQDTPLHLDRCQNELGHLRFDPLMDAETWRKNWSTAFTTTHKYTISTSKKLAQELAKLAKLVRVNAEQILKYETETGRFKKTMAKFKTALIHDLTEEDFADMYAQTIAYGLLYTAIRSHVFGEGNRVSSEQVQQLVLPTNPFLKEVMEDFFNIGARKWDSEKEIITGVDFDEFGINDIITILKDERTDFDQILRDFNNKNPNEDPVIHFYELFLKEYDALKRKSRGVYYTPQPVVSFIVRSVDEVLKQDFNLPLGLADTSTWGQVIEKNPNIKLPDGVSEDDFFVQILDPALGTGTFLVEAIDLIHKTMVETWQRQGKDADQIKQLWSRYVPDCLLSRLYGFELMMAPYAIAHMKIGIKLFETGYWNFQQDNQRVRVYLTNTLEGPINTAEYLDNLDPAMAEETRAANEVKSSIPITVIVGNPPYSRSSWNKGEYIEGMINLYKEEVRSEKNIQPLSDDYIKFLRISHSFLTQVPFAVFGMITNHTYISGRIHRGIRHSISKDFNQIRIIDLHGSQKTQSKVIVGQQDENVFDIMQGVAVSIWCRGSFRNPSIRHGEIVGPRSLKCDLLSKAKCQDIATNTLDPLAPLYLWIPHADVYQVEYDDYVPLNRLFRYFNVSGKPGDDGLLVSFKTDEVIPKLRAFLASIESDEPPKLTEAGHKLVDRGASVGFKEGRIEKYAYRPFDNRWTYYDTRFWTRAVADLRDCIDGSLVLLTTKIVKDSTFCHAFVTRLFPDVIFLSNTSSVNCYSFPISLPKSAAFLSDGTDENGLNINKVRAREMIGEDTAPDVLIHYVYAILHSATYRSRYFDYLRYDFPKIPRVSNTMLRKSLCQLGADIVALHLLEDSYPSASWNQNNSTCPLVNAQESTPFCGNGSKDIDRVGEKGKKLKDVHDGKGRLFINKTQYFDSVPDDVWNFHIGGYQVCYKWLYDRKKAGRKLSTEDIEHYQKIVVAINETIKIMKQIDEVIESHCGWPIK